VTNGILSKLINEIGEAQADARSESYSMINVRPGDKVAAMLDLLSKLAGKSPSALITDEISRRLADYAASSTINADAIMDAAEHALERENAYGFQEGSALDYLQKAGILAIEDPIKKQMREILISSKKN